MRKHAWNFRTVRHPNSRHHIEVTCDCLHRFRFVFFFIQTEVYINKSEINYKYRLTFNQYYVTILHLHK